MPVVVTLTCLVMIAPNVDTSSESTVNITAIYLTTDIDIHGEANVGTCTIFVWACLVYSTLR